MDLIISGVDLEDAGLLYKVRKFMNNIAYWNDGINRNYLLSRFAIEKIKGTGK
jgi:hypothetical protein